MQGCGGRSGGGVLELFPDVGGLEGAKSHEVGVRERRRSEAGRGDVESPSRGVEEWMCGAWQVGVPGGKLGGGEPGVRPQRGGVAWTQRRVRWSRGVDRAVEGGVARNE